MDWCFCCADAAYHRTEEQGYGMVGNISVILFCYSWMRWRGVFRCDPGLQENGMAYALVSASIFDAVKN